MTSTRPRPRYRPLLPLRLPWLLPRLLPLPLAPMPGNVLKVLVKPGEAVTEGQTLVILEAMKMENEINAPSAGTVKQIVADVGSVVATGDTLILI